MPPPRGCASRDGSRAELLARRIWNREFDRKNNAIDVAVRRLRIKLDEPFQTRLLHTVRGEGYVLEDRPEEHAGV